MRAITVGLVLAFASSCTCFSVGFMPLRAGAPRRVLSPQAAQDLGIVTGQELKPLGDSIVIDLQSVPSTTQAGILLPTVFEDEDEDDAFVKPEPRAGTVLAVGPGALTKDGARAPMPSLASGQKVVVAPTAGTRIPLDGRPLRESTIFLFKAEDIWASC